MYIVMTRNSVEHVIVKMFSQSTELEDDRSSISTTAKCQ